MKQPRIKISSKTSVPAMLQTLELYYRESEGDPVLADFAAHIWHAAESIRELRGLAQQVALEGSRERTAPHDNGDAGIWSPLSSYQTAFKH
jgi:hypothetical protein